ncbi:surface protease GP63, partial [Trypanosoma theileri]
AAHEIAHALGFDYKNFVDNKMVSTLENLRGKSRVVVVSAKLQEEAQKHYGCEDLEGVELAYADIGMTEVASHWAYRVAKDELMSSDTTYGAGYYTALTMGAFDGLPYYTANWGMEEPMTWGNGSGCEFIRGNCITNGQSKFPDMFCKEAVSRCTSDRFSVGVCSSLNGFYGKDEADECPYASPEATQTSEGLMRAPCTLMLTNKIPGSVTGNDSWCLDGESLVVKDATDTDKNVGGVCARVSCEEGKVMVMYAGNDNWYHCPEGDFLEPTSTSFVSGKIKCPKYREVCTIAPDGTSLLPLVE